MFGQVDASGVGGVRLIVSGVCMKSPCAAAVLPAPLLQPLIDPSIQNSHHSAVIHRTALEFSTSVSIATLRRYWTYFARNTKLDGILLAKPTPALTRGA
jgi:hypothetical protein